MELMKYFCKNNFYTLFELLKRHEYHFFLLNGLNILSVVIFTLTS